jgi:hypothetical protein
VDSAGAVKIDNAETVFTTPLYVRESPLRMIRFSPENSQARKKSSEADGVTRYG